MYGEDGAHGRCPLSTEALSWSTEGGQWWQSQRQRGPDMSPLIFLKHIYVYAFHVKRIFCAMRNVFF